MISDLTFYRKI